MTYEEFVQDYDAVVASKSMATRRPALPEGASSADKDAYAAWQLWRTALARYREIYTILSRVSFDSTDLVLEYGAWSSVSCVYLQRRCVPQGQVYAVDVFQVELRTDRHAIYRVAPTPEEWKVEVESYEAPTPVVRREDIQATTFDANTFDKVVSFGVHEHVVDDVKAMREIHRILKPGGILGMTVDFAWTGWDYRPEMLGRCYDPQRLTALVAASGLRWVEPPSYAGWESTADNRWDKPHLGAFPVILRK